MNRLLTVFAALALTGCAGLGGGQIQEDSVTYYDGTTVMKGYIVYDASIKSKRPGVVVVHEWWGITQHTRDEARNLALKLLERQPGTTRMLRVVVSSSCILGDGETAQKYWTQLPEFDRGQMTTRCERFGVTFTP